MKEFFLTSVASLRKTVERLRRSHGGYTSIANYLNHRQRLVEAHNCSRQKNGPARAASRACVDAGMDDTVLLARERTKFPSRHFL